MTDHEQGSIGPLSDHDLDRLDAYWRAANYVSVGQIHLLENPLLTEPPRPEHVKPRLLGHWGTTPGLNFVYVHMNRLIKLVTYPRSGRAAAGSGRQYLDGSGQRRLGPGRYGPATRLRGRTRARPSKALLRA